MVSGQDKSASKGKENLIETARQRTGKLPGEAVSPMSTSEHPAPATPPMKTKTQKLRLVAEIALAGLRHSVLSPEDRADFYEGLAAILPPPASDAALYAAMCLRESLGAQRALRAAVETGEGAA
jgi:hypothetical protein